MFLCLSCGRTLGFGSNCTELQCIFDIIDPIPMTLEEVNTRPIIVSIIVSSLLYLSSLL